MKNNKKTFDNKNRHTLITLMSQASTLLELSYEIEKEIVKREDESEFEHVQTLLNQKKDLILKNLVDYNILSALDEQKDKIQKNIVPNSISSEIKSEIKSKNVIRSNPLADLDERLHLLRTTEVKIITQEEEKDDEYSRRLLGNIKYKIDLEIIAALDNILDTSKTTTDSLLELIVNLIKSNCDKQALNLYEYWATNSGEHKPCYVFNAIIETFGKKKKLDFVLYIYTEALKFAKFNTFTFNYALDAAIRALDFETAQEIYHCAITAKKADFTTHCIAMRFRPKIKNSLITPKNYVKDISNKISCVLRPTPVDTALSETKEKDVKETNTKPLLSNKDIADFLEAIGVNEEIITEMYNLGGYATGKFVTLLGIFYYYSDSDRESILSKAKLIGTNDFDFIVPTHSINKKVNELKKLGYTEKKREPTPKSTWANMSKPMLGGKPIDLSVTDKKKYKQARPPLIVAGKLSVFSKQNLPSNVNDYDFLLFKDFYLAFHKKDENFPAFQFHCQNVGECWVDADLSPRSLKVALKSFLFVKELSKEKNPAINKVMPIPGNRELISYPELLTNLPQFFSKQIDAKNLEQTCQGLYNLLNYLDFRGHYAQINLRAIIQEYILSHINNNQVKLPNIYTLDQMTTFAYDSLETLFITDRPSKAFTMGKEIEKAASKSIKLYKDGQFVEKFPFGSEFKPSPHYINQSFLLATSEPSNLDEKYEESRLPTLEIKKNEDPILSYLEKKHQKNISEILIQDIKNINKNYFHPLMDLLEKNSLLNINLVHTYKTPEFIQLRSLNGERIYLNTDSKNKPLIERLNEIFSQGLLNIDQFIDKAEIVLNNLNKGDIYLEANEIFLKCLNDLITDGVFSNAIKIEKAVRETITVLEKMTNPLKTAKQDQKTQFGSNMAREIRKLQELVSISNTKGSKFMAKSTNQFLWMRAFFPWITRNLNDNKKEIVNMVERFFLNAYSIFLYFERGMLVHSIPNNLALYMKFQNNLLTILRKYINFLDKQGIKNLGSIFYFSNDTEKYELITSTETITIPQAEPLMRKLQSITAMKAKISAAQFRINSITNKATQLQEIADLLTEITNLSHYGLDLSDRSSLMTAMRAGCILKTNNLIKTTLSSKNELLLWVLQALKLNIEFNSILFNMTDPFVTLGTITNIVNSFKTLISSPEWNRLISIWSTKKEDIYFNNFNILSPLLDCAIQLQKLLYYTLWVAKKIEHPDIYTTNLLLNNIGLILHFQNTILAKRIELDEFYGVCVNRWLFMDENLCYYDYKQPSGKIELTIEPILDFHTIGIDKCKNLQQQLLKEVELPSKIFNELQHFMLTSLNQLAQNYKGRFSPPLSFDNALENDYKFEDAKPSTDIEEWNISLQNEIKAINDIHKKSLEKNKKLLEEQDEKAEKIYREISSIEQKQNSSNKSLSENTVTQKIKQKKTKKFIGNPVTLHSTGSLPHASFSHLPMVVIHESFPEEIKKECKEMATLFISIREMIDEGLPDDPIKKLATKIAKFGSYIASVNPQISIRGLLHKGEIYDYVASQYITSALPVHPMYSCNYLRNAMNVLEQSSENYSKIPSLIKDNLELKPLLELTLQNTTKILDLYKHAKNVLNDKIRRENEIRQEIIEKREKWWYTHLKATGTKQISWKAERYKTMQDCVRALDLSTNQLQELEHRVRYYQTISDINFNELTEFPPLKKRTNEIESSQSGENKVSYTEQTGIDSQDITLSNSPSSNSAIQLKDVSQERKEKEQNQVSLKNSINQTMWSTPTSLQEGGEEKDFKKILESYRSEDNKDNPKFQTLLGNCYRDGKGVDKDLKEAVRLYHLAADKGYVLAQYFLGCCYEKGTGVDIDFEKAKKYYLLAAKEGNILAHNAYNNLDKINRDSTASVSRYGLNQNY